MEGRREVKEKKAQELHPSEMVAFDDSFKKPGAIPFEWEIKPGVPKLSHHHQRQHPVHHERLLQPADDRSVPSTPSKLKPPPSGSYFTSPSDHLSSVSLRSTRSACKRFDPPSNRKPEPVSMGCFRPALFRKNWFKKSLFYNSSSKVEIEKEVGCTSELGTLARWSVSRRKSLLSFSRSSSISSYRSSPRSVGDTE